MEYKQRLLSLDYEAQHFEIHPRNFIDEVYNQFFENLASCLESLKKHLIQEHSDVLAPSCISILTDEFLHEYTKRLDKCIDKLELYISDNLMCVDAEATLPEDKIHIVNPCTKGEYENIDKEIEELKRKILEEKAKRHNLKKILSEQNQVIKRLFFIRNELEQLLKTASDMGVTKENIETLYSHLEKLVSVVQITRKEIIS